LTREKNVHDTVFSIEVGFVDISDDQLLLLVRISGRGLIL